MYGIDPRTGRPIAHPVRAPRRPTRRSWSNWLSRPPAAPRPGAWGGLGTPGTNPKGTRTAGLTPPPAGAQLPVDPIYDQQVAGVNQGYGDALAGLNQQQLATLADYGYTATFDDQGKVTGLTYDPSNPFSRAALLRKHYQQAKTGTTNSLAAHGQLYSGAMVNAQDANDRGYLQGENTLQSGLTGRLTGFAQRRREAGTRHEQDLSQAGAERVGRARDQDTGDEAFAGQPAATAAPARTAPRVIRNYRSPSGRVGTLHIYADGRRVFVPK
jgi:hypothetical protein